MTEFTSPVLQGIVHSLNANTKGCNEKLLTNTGSLSYFTANLYRFATSFCIPHEADSDKWQKNVRKRPRQAEYTNTKGKTVEARKMKDIHCKKSLKIPKG
jgi:hypothetical protein